MEEGKKTIMDLAREMGQNLDKPSKNVVFCLDRSGSTCETFVYRNTTILDKEMDLVEKYILQHQDEKVRLITFCCQLHDHGIIRPVDGDIVNLPDVISNGSTMTHLPLIYIHDKLIIESHQKIDLIYIITDGQTNSTSSEITTILGKLYSLNIEINIIAISPDNDDMEIISSREQNYIPGMDLINYSNNFINKLIIYNSKHNPIPYEGIRRTFLSKNTLYFFDIPLYKKEGYPILFVFTQFINKLLFNIENNIENIDFGRNYILFRKMVIEIGTKLVLFYSDFSEDNTYINNLAIRLSLLVPLLPDNENNKKIFQLLKYGYDSCYESFKQGIEKISINDINIENRIQEASIKRQQFKDAECLLFEKGITLGSKEVISYPTISNNRCLIIEEEEDV